MAVSDSAPLILTLALDEKTRGHLDGLRRTHFPPDRNFLAAHVTAFHSLPGERLQDLVRDVRDSAPRSPVVATVTGVRFLGRGVAYDLRAPEAESVRAGLAHRWHPLLSGQDGQRWRPHVTVQNKVAPEMARALYTHLRMDFVPYDAQAVGWELFRYRGGPWQNLLSVPFT